MCEAFRCAARSDAGHRRVINPNPTGWAQPPTARVPVRRGQAEDGRAVRPGHASPLHRPSPLAVRHGQGLPPVDLVGLGREHRPHEAERCRPVASSSPAATSPRPLTPSATRAPLKFSRESARMSSVPPSRDVGKHVPLGRSTARSGSRRRHRRVRGSRGPVPFWESDRSLRTPSDMIPDRCTPRRLMVHSDEVAEHACLDASSNLFPTETGPVAPHPSSPSDSWQPESTQSA